MFSKIEKLEDIKRGLQEEIIRKNMQVELLGGSENIKATYPIMLEVHDLKRKIDAIYYKIRKLKGIPDDKEEDYIKPPLFEYIGDLDDGGMFDKYNGDEDGL